MDKPKETAHVVANVVYNGPEAVERRLDELDREWSAGRVAKAVAGVAIVAGLTLAYFVHYFWLALPVIVGLLFLQYTVSRSSLLTTACIAAGFRTSTDIEHERMALMALRGDFRHLPMVMDKHDDAAISRMADEGGIDVPDTINPDPKETAQKVLENLKRDPESK